MTQFKIVLGSSVRKQKWLDLQNKNAKNNDIESIILTDGFETKENIKIYKKKL